MSGRISEQRLELGGFEIALRRSEGEGTPVVFCHGNPSHSVDWLPFMERLQAPAIAMDMPCSGRSERPDRDRFAATMHDYGGWIGAALDDLGLDRFKLVVHDWGAVALHPASRRADCVERLVAINAVPLLRGYRWHRVARLWRTRGVGEALNATITRPAFATVLRQARPGLRPMPAEWLDEIWGCYDAGTRAAILRLYRSADPAKLEAAGAHLGRLRCPAMVVWGASDPYLQAALGRRYAERLPDAELVELEAAGHWPWFDKPELVDRVTEFLN